MTFRLSPVAAAALAFHLLPAAAKDAPDASSATQLNEVKVVENVQNNDYAPARSTVGGKLPTELRDIPQVVNIVNRAVLDAQNATSLTDALRNVPGITMTAGEGGQIGDNVNLRGFSARTDIYLDGMRDRGQYRRDTFALDSVEVLKGPSSLFFGRGSTGGVINQVSKTPTRDALSQVSLSLGTDQYYRGTADFNRPLSDHAATRVALMWQDIDSTRDVVNNRDWGVAPSLKTALNDKTDLTLSALVQHNRDIPDYGIPFLFGKPADVSYDRFFGDTDDYFNQDVYVGKLRLDHRATSWLTIRNQFQATQDKLNARPTPYRVCTTAINTSAPPCTVSPVGTPLDQITVQSDRRDRAITDTSVFDQLDVIADLNTGAIKHTLVGGAEVGRDRTYNQGYTWTPRELATLGDFTPGPTPSTAVRTRAATHTEGNADTLGLYLNDTISLNSQWKLVGGLRWDRFKALGQVVNNSDGSNPNTTIPGTPPTTVPNKFTRTDHGTSLRGGAVYQPTSAQSYYVSYGTSFNPSGEAVTISAAQSGVAPEKTRSYEAGAKWDVLDGGLSLSSAVFHIEKYNARTTDPVTSVVTLDGNTQVDGFEIGAVGRITRQWQVIAGYTYLDSELVKAVDNVSTTINGSTPIVAPVKGNQLANTPKNSGSLWTTYRFLEHFEAGGGVYYVDKRYITNSNLTSVDSYWRVDATLAYHQPSFDVQLNVQNLLDEDYFDSIVASENGRAVPGRGRTAIATGTYRF